MPLQSCLLCFDTPLKAISAVLDVVSRLLDLLQALLLEGGPEASGAFKHHLCAFQTQLTNTMDLAAQLLGNLSLKQARVQQLSIEYQKFRDTANALDEALLLLGALSLFPHTRRDNYHSMAFHKHS